MSELMWRIFVIIMIIIGLIIVWYFVYRPRNRYRRKRLSGK